MYRLKIVFVIIFILLIFLLNLQSGKRGELKVVFINVGQGNSHLIITPSGHKILIDGGPEGSAYAIKKILKKFGVKKRIDIIILSNPQSANVGGLTEILNSFDVGEIYDPGMPFSTFLYENFLETIMSKQDELAEIKGAEIEKRLSDILAARHHFEYFNPRAGKILNWGPDVNVVVLSPRRLYHNTHSDPNNNSIVIKLKYGKISFLFAGDIEERAEMDLLALGPKLKSTIIKVPNFGSAYSSTPVFVKKVKPKFAIISVGKNNPYGYPASTVLQKYKNIGAKIYRTDLNGSIVVTTDGYSLKIKPEIETPEATILAQVYEKVQKETTGNEFVQTQKININSASAEQLVSLPGVGAFKAQMIVKYRNKHGNFKSINELVKVPGINKAILNKIKDKITVD